MPCPAPRSTPRRVMAGIGLGAVATIGAVGGWLLVTAAVRRGADLRDAPRASIEPDQLLATLAMLVAGLLLSWVAVTGLLSVLGQVPGALGRGFARAAGRCAPRIVRAAVAAAVGTAVAVAGAGPAGATTGSAGPVRPAATAGAPTPTATAATAEGGTALPDPGWTPNPPPAPPTSRPGEVGLVSAPGAPGRQLEDEVVVRRGDTLWAIAARHLGPDASAAQVAAAWPRWYAANRRVIGADPDLLRPGQLLEPPIDRGDHR
jgi:nucleoid-associated protein YgaU